MTIRYRKALKIPSAKVLRRVRNENGERLFKAKEIRALQTAAKPQLQAMILLGINCGFGNRDCATLPVEALDLQDGWHRYWRPKTQIPRRCPLWPETVEALRRVVGDRKSGLVFVTKYGNPWMAEDRRCPISYEFRKVATKIKIYRAGVTTFYSLRRTFETMASTASVHQSVIDAIMGHAAEANDMGAVYRQKVFDDQLQKCVEHVHKWYLGKVNIS